MDHIRQFSALTSQSAAIAGGKGASLGELTQAGIPVPPGFVVTAETFRTFVDQLGIGAEIQAQLANVDVHDTNSLERASEAIQSLFVQATVPELLSSEILRSFDALNHEFVAVRSSATAEDSAATSWAGELETYLYTTKTQLLDNVKKCWASLYTPRAIFYRIEQRLHEADVAVAVVVQAMVASEVSGVCFTVHPVTKDPDQLIIEAGWGLGEAIVGGLITPDSYVVSKRDGTIVDTYISQQRTKIVRRPTGGTEEVEVHLDDRERRKLSEAHVAALAQLCQRIEQHYGAPQDIEWALADGKLWITQSRPITTL